LGEGGGGSKPASLGSSGQLSWWEGLGGVSTTTSSCLFLHDNAYLDSMDMDMCISIWWMVSGRYGYIDTSFSQII
jgi:hypothetical protein